MLLIFIVVNLNTISVLIVHSSSFSNYPVVYLRSSGAPNIHNAWPHSLVTFQDLRQTPHQNQAKIRSVQDRYPTTTTTSSPFPSVASCISDWEQRLPVDSSSQARHPDTPQYRSRTPTPHQGTSSVGRRRGQHWALDSEAPATTLVYGRDLEAGKRVSLCVLDVLKSTPSFTVNF